MNWQIVSLRVPVRELLDAPVLYIAGNKPLEFSAADEAKLKEYCEQGGLLMANPDCGNDGFAESFRKLGSRMFPDYKFRELPDNHPIYINEQYPRKLWKAPPSLMGLSNGVRELMVMAPAADAGRHWQVRETGKHLPEYQLADDVLLYSIDKNNLQEKGRTFVVDPLPAVTPTRTIKLARLQYAGNWDPEPGGWRRLAAILRNDSHVDLQLSIVKLGEGKLGSGKKAEVKVASLTGTEAVKLDTTSRDEIKKFVEGGGTLIVDAAGGKIEFASAAESELQAIFGNAAKLDQPLPPSAAEYNLPGGLIKEFLYRPYARANLGSLHGPLVCGITVNNRTGVYYSRLDLSGGLVGQPTDGINGYEPATATKLMSNLVIVAGLGNKASVTPTR